LPDFKRLLLLSQKPYKSSQTFEIGVQGLMAGTRMIFGGTRASFYYAGLHFVHHPAGPNKGRKDQAICKPVNL
jgi:hypothetical protein